MCIVNQAHKSHHTAMTSKSINALPCMLVQPRKGNYSQKIHVNKLINRSINQSINILFLSHISILNKLLQHVSIIWKNVYAYARGKGVWDHSTLFPRKSTFNFNH